MRFKPTNTIYRDKDKNLTITPARGNTLFCAPGCEIPVEHPEDAAKQSTLESEAKAVDASGPVSGVEEVEEAPTPHNVKEIQTPEPAVEEQDEVRYDTIAAEVGKMEYNDMRSELIRSGAVLTTNPKKPEMMSLLIAHRFWASMAESTP